MKSTNKWVLLAVAVIVIGINIWQGDFSAYKVLSAADLVPVVGIVAVIFLLKFGALSAIIIGLKKLLEWLKNR